MRAKKLFAAHGHRYSVKSGYERIAAHAAKLGADIVLFGHTHISMSLMLQIGECVNGVTLTKPLLLFNPGSLGDNVRPTFGTILISDDLVLPSIAEY